MFSDPATLPLHLTFAGTLGVGFLLFLCQALFFAVLLSLAGLGSTLSHVLAAVAKKASSTRPIGDLTLK
jgi:hypothetical protein